CRRVRRPPPIPGARPPSRESAPPRASAGRLAPAGGPSARGAVRRHPTAAGFPGGAMRRHSQAAWVTTEIGRGGAKRPLPMHPSWTIPAWVPAKTPLARTSGGSGRQAAASRSGQSPRKGLDRAGAVRQGVLGRLIELGQRAAGSGHLEHRVVAEPGAPPPRLADALLEDALANPLAPVRE